MSDPYYLFMDGVFLYQFLFCYHCAELSALLWRWFRQVYFGIFHFKSFQNV